MAAISRGIKNAFRNKIRATSITVILGLGIGMTFSMLIANRAIASKIDRTMSEAGTSINVYPSFGKANNVLSDSILEKLKNISNIKEIIPILNIEAQSPEAKKRQEEKEKRNSSENGSFLNSSRSGSNLVETNLQNRQKLFGNQEEEANIQLTGVQNVNNTADKSFNLISGQAKFSDLNAAEGIISKSLAEQNNLQVGSTFTLKNKSIKIIGIFEETYDLGTIYLPLKFAQNLTDDSSQIRSINILADNIHNVESVKADTLEALGKDNVELFAESDSTIDAIKNLSGVKDISFISFLASLLAASAIIFLMMMLVVRERRREIGVLKALGAPTKKINIQFVFEALSLVSLGTIVGIFFTIISSQKILQSLVNANNNNNGSGNDSTMSISSIEDGEPISNNIIGTIDSMVTPEIILMSVLGIIFIAIAGSLAPAWFSSKIRPIEALRGE